MEELNPKTFGAWFWLLLAGFAEIAWATGLKYSAGFSKLWPSVFSIITMLLSFWLLSKAMKTLPLGTSYAVWTGIGIAGTAILGMLFLGDSKSAAKLFFIILIIAGIIGVRMVD